MHSEKWSEYEYVPKCAMVRQKYMYTQRVLFCRKRKNAVHDARLIVWKSCENDYELAKPQREWYLIFLRCNVAINRFDQRIRALISAWKMYAAPTKNGFENWAEESAGKKLGSPV